MTEKELVQKFRDQYELVNLVESNLEIAKKDLETTKQQLLELFEQTETERSATYEGIGFISRTKPRLYASCPEENKTLLFEILRAQDRADLIKENVNPQTLSSYVSELLENGQPVPECISFILKPGLRLYTK